MLSATTELTITKNTLKLLAILVAMQIRRYNAGRIAWWSTSWASLEATGCCHQAIAYAVLPQPLRLWSTNLGGAVEKMCFFQMAPIPPLSVSICSTRCQYDILKVWLKKNNHFLTCGAAKVHIFCVLVTELVTDLFLLGTDPILVLPRL